MRANVKTSKRQNVEMVRGRIALWTFGRLDVWTIFLALLVVADIHAAQHLVGPGNSWSELAERVRPGDEIILMPGRHEPASLDGLRGTREKPITIRGLTLEQPSIIEARQHGIRLRRPQHIIIRDLAITGATVSGVSITNEPFSRDPKGSVSTETVGPNKDPWPAHITIRNVTIERTGPHGRRNAIHLEGVRHVVVERVRIEGWGGAAVKVAGSSDVRIEHSIMRGRSDHGQLSGVHIHGGSANVRVARCLFTDAGEAAILLGDVGPSSASKDAPAHESQRVTVERNVIRRGESAIAFLSAEQCFVRNNTIIDPKRFAYFIAGPGRLRQATFGANIMVWDRHEPEALSHVQPPAKAEGLAVEQNLWWVAANALTHRSPLHGDVRAEQVVDVDPDLDGQFKPRNRRAQMFGTEGP